MAFRFKTPTAAAGAGVSISPSVTNAIFRLLHMKKILLILSFCFALALGASAAEQRIATVDLKKLFDNYYRTKQQDAKLKTEAAELEKDAKEMMEQLQKGDEKYTKMLDAAKDPAISAAEREKRSKEAENQLIDLRGLKNRLDQYNATSRARLDEQKRRMRDTLLSEIRDTIKAKIRGSGYTMVIDVGAESAIGTPIVLYSSGNDDLTDSVLKELNVGAPPPTPEKKDK
jgi:outer membrane protein